jgi:hypothetical protein
VSRGITDGGLLRLLDVKTDLVVLRRKCTSAVGRWPCELW